MRIGGRDEYRSLYREGAVRQVVRGGKACGSYRAADGNSDEGIAKFIASRGRGIGHDQQNRCDCSGSNLQSPHCPENRCVSRVGAMTFTERHCSDACALERGLLRPSIVLRRGCSIVKSAKGWHSAGSWRIVRRRFRVVALPYKGVCFFVRNDCELAALPKILSTLTPDFCDPHLKLCSDRMYVSGLVGEMQIQ
jgi:hypothetical protein